MRSRSRLQIGKKNPNWKAAPIRKKSSRLLLQFSEVFVVFRPSDPSEAALKLINKYKVIYFRVSRRNGIQNGILAKNQDVENVKWREFISKQESDSFLAIFFLVFFHLSNYFSSKRGTVRKKTQQSNHVVKTETKSTGK